MELPRRKVLLASAAAAALAASGYRGVAAADPAPPIEAGLAALEDQYNAKVGFYGLNLSSNRMLGYRENDMFATCSAFKAYVAAQILQKDQRGELRLTDELYIDPARFVPVASPITEPNIGGWMTLSDLCAAAVRQSDNTATNLMLELLGGPASVTQFARSVGDDRTWMVRWEKMADDLGIERTVDITDLTYNDPHRADATEWLNAHGWNASGTMSTDEMRRLDRWVDVPDRDVEDGFSTFVVAQRG